MNAKPFIVVSGLPASGKTSLAIRLAGELNLPLLDKDDILEALFESHETVDVEVRQRLSRMSDAVLARLAVASQGAVLVSFWRHHMDNGHAGTPVDWVRALPGPMVEVHCVCDPEVAEGRFRARRRHPGHNDDARFPALSRQLEQLSKRGPLGLGPTVIVRTDEPFDLAGVIATIRQHID